MPYTLSSTKGNYLFPLYISIKALAWMFIVGSVNPDIMEWAVDSIWREYVPVSECVLLLEQGFSF